MTRPGIKLTTEIVYSVNRLPSSLTDTCEIEVDESYFGSRRVRGKRVR